MPLSHGVQTIDNPTRRYDPRNAPCFAQGEGVQLEFWTRYPPRDYHYQLRGRTNVCTRPVRSKLTSSTALVTRGAARMLAPAFRQVGRPPWRPRGPDAHASRAPSASRSTRHHPPDRARPAIRTRHYRTQERGAAFHLSASRPRCDGYVKETHDTPTFHIPNVAYIPGVSGSSVRVVTAIRRDTRAGRADEQRGPRTVQLAQLVDRPGQQRRGLGVQCPPQLSDRGDHATRAAVLTVEVGDVADV